MLSKSKAMDITGKRFGFLTAVEYTEQRNSNGKRLWRCVCDCGNEKLVLASSLNNGGTKSCGCLNHRSKINAGDRYGKLVVLKRIGQKTKNGGAMCLCRCDCGNEKEYPATWLSQGRATSCGCAQGVARVDIKDRRFGHLVALNPTDQRDSGAVVWACRCDCGNTAYRSHISLKRGGERTSCGCARSKASRDNMDKALHRVDNTIIEIIESGKPTARSTSGVRGVSFDRTTQKWRAVLGFQKKQIFLGRYDTKEEAAAARKQAEKDIYEPFLQAYYESRNITIYAFPDRAALVHAVIKVDEYENMQV